MKFTSEKIQLYAHALIFIILTWYTFYFLLGYVSVYLVKVFQVGAFIMNAGYAVFLLFKNKTWNRFKAEGAIKAYKWAIMTGVFWFAALGGYGQGAALMGD